MHLIETFSAGVSWRVGEGLDYLGGGNTLWVSFYLE